MFTDRTLETSTTVGTGTLTTSGVGQTGYQSFATAGLNAQTCDYCIEAVDASGVPTGAWEVGRGVYTTAGSTLTRATVLSSSNANALVNFAAGTKNVFATVAAASIGGGAFLPLTVTANPTTVDTGGNQLRFVTPVNVNGRPVQIGNVLPDVAPFNNQPGLFVAYEGVGSSNPGLGLVASGTRIPVFRAYRSRGTLAAPTDLLANDAMFSVVAYGYCAGAYNFQAQYGVLCDGAPVGTNIAPKYYWTFSFNTGVQMSHAKGIELAAPLGFSWAAGLDATAAKDSGVWRAGVNLVETNTGTPGVLGDHILRDITVTGEIKTTDLNTIPLIIGEQVAGAGVNAPFDFPGVYHTSNAPTFGSVLGLVHASNDAPGMVIRSIKSRGTLAAPLDCSAGDVTGGYVHFAYAGGGYQYCGGMAGEVKSVAGAAAIVDFYWSSGAYGPNAYGETFRIGGDGIVTARVLRTKTNTVATLVAAATAGAGARSFVTDCSVAAAGNFGVTVTGGGAFKVPVYCDGAGWLIG